MKNKVLTLDQMSQVEGGWWFIIPIIIAACSASSCEGNYEFNINVTNSFNNNGLGTGIGRRRK